MDLDYKNYNPKIGFWIQLNSMLKYQVIMDIKVRSPYLS